MSGISQEISKNDTHNKSENYSIEEHTHLAKALYILKKKYDVYFIYETEVIDSLKIIHRVDISGNIFDDLEKIFQQHNLQYSLVGKKTIVIIKDKKNKIRFTKIRGFVTNTEGDPLVGAEIIIENSKCFDITDEKGAYIIDDIKKGEYLISAKMIGYKNNTHLVKVKSGNIINQNFFLDLDILDMEEIVTVACRNPFMKLESSVAITTANSTQISERAPSSTAELLKIIPGFYVESSGGEASNNLFPRGFPQDGSYRYVAMYEDGLPLFEAPELAFANIDIIMRLDESIRSMEGVRGGLSSIYASNAPGGIINFNSKTGGLNREAIIKFSIGTHDFKRVDFNYGGSISENINFNCGGFFRYSKGIRTPDYISNRGGQIKLNITRLFDNGYFRIYGKYLNDHNIFYLPIPLQNPDDPESIPGIDANYGSMTSIQIGRKTIPSPSGQLFHNDISDGIHPELISFSTEFLYDFGDGWSIQNNMRLVEADINFNAIFPLENPFDAYYFADSLKQLSSDSNVHRWEYRFSDNGKSIENISTLNDNGLISRNGWWTISKPLENFNNNLQINKEFGNHKISLAGYFSKYSADDFWYWQNILTEVKNSPRLLDLVGLDVNGNVVKPVTDNGFEQYGSFYVNAFNVGVVYSAYLTDEWYYSQKLRFDAGLRYESHHFQGKVENTKNDYIIGNGENLAKQNVVFGDGTFRSYKHKFNEWAFSLGANYSFNSHMAIYGRMNRGYRTPDFEQWIFSWERGNSQYIYQFEGGLKVAKPDFSLFSSFFVSHINNIPFIDEVFEDGRVVEQNRFATSRTIGAEIEAVYLASPLLRFDFIGTFQDPRLVELKTNIVNTETGSITKTNFDGKQVRRIPSIILDFRPSLNYLDFAVFFSWQYVGDRYVDDANTALLSGYNLISFGSNYCLYNNKIKIALNISNLTNTLGLTEGNPRIEQAYAGRREKIFLARPILGRSITLSLTLKI